MDYSEEFLKADALKSAMELVIEVATQIHPDYLLLNGVVIEALLGVVPVLHVPCEDEECEVSGQEPIGGLLQAYQDLRSVMTTLEDEISIEETPEFQDHPDYDI